MVLMCSHPYSCTLQEFNLETFRLSKHWWWWMLPTRNGKRKLCKLNPYINNEIFCMCAIESEGYLWLMRTFTDAEQELCEVFMVLKGYKDLQKLRQSACCTSVWYASRRRYGTTLQRWDGAFCLPPFIGFDICCWENGEGGGICM